MASPPDRLAGHRAVGRARAGGGARRSLPGRPRTAVAMAYVLRADPGRDVRGRRGDVADTRRLLAHRHPPQPPHTADGNHHRQADGRTLPGSSRPYEGPTGIVGALQDVRQASVPAGSLLNSVPHYVQQVLSPKPRWRSWSGRPSWPAAASIPSCLREAGEEYEHPGQRTAGGRRRGSGLRPHLGGGLRQRRPAPPSSCRCRRPDTLATEPSASCTTRATSTHGSLSRAGLTPRRPC